MRMHFFCAEFKLQAVSYIVAQKGYGSTDCGNQITGGCHWKGIRFLKPATISGGVFIRFFFRFFFFSFSFRFIVWTSGRVKKKKKVNLLHQAAKETGCLSGQLYIRVLDLP